MYSSSKRLRQSEIELHGGKLPQAADGIDQLHIDLGAVERRFIRNDGGVDAEAVAGLAQRAFGQFPLIGLAVVFAAGAAIPGGNLGFVFVEAESLQGVDGEIEAVHDFVFDLFRRAEDVRVVLSKAAHAQQAMHGAGALIAVNGAEFAQAHRQIAITVLAIAIDQDVAGAVHRLELVLGVVQLHRSEHVFRIEIGVAGGLPEIAAHDVRRVNKRVAALQISVAHPVFELLADDAALGMEEDQPGAGEFLNAEKIELLAELAVVALLRLFELVEVLVKVFFREPGSAVDALELLVFLVAFPVGAGDGKQLERLDFRRVRNVRAAAEIDEMRAERVFGKTGRRLSLR